MKSRKGSKKVAPLLVSRGGKAKKPTLEDLVRLSVGVQRTLKQDDIGFRVSMEFGPLGVPAPKAVPAAMPTIEAASRPRFVNIDHNGKPTANGGWVYDRCSQLVWARGVLDGDFTYTDALKACEKIKFMGQACRAPTLQERFGINDYAKHSPALDTAHFKKESGWEWTATLDASSPSDDAWFVFLSGGYCSRYGQSYHGHVRPVLAGQQFNFNF